MLSLVIEGTYLNKCFQLYNNLPILWKQLQPRWWQPSLTIVLVGMRKELVSRPQNFCQTDYGISGPM
jgi:hypothetical protein